VAVIDPESPCFTIVTAIDVQGESAPGVSSLLTRRIEECACKSSGFVSASLLARRGPASEAGVGDGPSRLLEYAQWASGASHERFLERTDTAELSAEIVARSISCRSETYELDALISGRRCLDIVAPETRLTLVVIMQPHRGKQAFINRYNQAETHDFFSGFEGFLGVAFHLAESGSVLEYLQWESMRALSAASSTDRFRTHLETNEKNCDRTDFGFYDVVRTITLNVPPV
jgi:hypothetical protein